MRISSKQKRWLTKEMIVYCMVISLAIIIIAFILELAQMVFSPDLSSIARAIFLLFMWGLLSGVIWFLGFTAPDLMEIVFQMLGFKEKEENKIMTKILRIRCPYCSHWNRIRVDEFFVEQPSSERKVKVLIPFYKPLKIERCGKCNKIIARPNELIRIDGS